MVKPLKPIGILDPEGKNINPLTGKKYRDLYTIEPEYQIHNNINNYQILALGHLIDGWTKLKVWEKAEEIINQIKKHQVLIIESGTGTGKTVILPKLALHALDYKGKVAVTVPKTSLAADSAKYAAACLDVVLGEEVGFQHRGATIKETVFNEETSEDTIEFRDAKSDKTKLLFSTDGMLRAQAVKDPLFKNFNLVMIDEAHERNTNIDLLVLKLRNALEKNDNLKLIITSATLDMNLFVNYFKEKGLDVATNTVSLGGNKPVEVEYLKKGVSVKENPGKCIEIFFEKIVKPNLPGDTIIFANSENNAKRMCQEISKRDPSIYCIVATATTLEKDKNIEPLAKSKDLYKTFFPGKNYTRKVIIATDVWESSITLKEVIFVIDNGLTLSSGYEGDKMESYLLTKPIAKSQATQRKGRAGRVYPGFCYRVYEEKDFERMDENKPVNITNEDFTESLMDLWSVKDDETLEELVVYIRELLTKPSAANIRSSLLKINALNLSTSYMGRSSVLTDFGKLIYEHNRAGDIRLTKALFYSKVYDCFYDMVIIVSVLLSKQGISDLIDVDPDNKNKTISKMGKYKNKYGDIFAAKKIMEEFMDTVYRNNETIKSSNQSSQATRNWCYKNYIHHNNCRKIYEAAEKLSHFRIAKEYLNTAEDIKFKSYEDKIIYCLMKGLYINLAHKKGKQYENLFPNIKTRAVISPVVAQKATFFTEENLPEYIMYKELKRMDSGVKFIDCVAVPNYLIDYLTPTEKNWLNL